MGTDLKGRKQSSRMQLLPPGITATAPAAYSTGFGRLANPKPLQRGTPPIGVSGFCFPTLSFHLKV